MPPPLFDAQKLRQSIYQCWRPCLADTSRLLYPSGRVLELESETRLAIMLILTLGGHSGFRVTGTGQVHGGNPTATAIFDLRTVTRYAPPAYPMDHQEAPYVTSLSDRQRRLCRSHV